MQSGYYYAGIGGRFVNHRAARTRGVRLNQLFVLSRASLCYNVANLYQRRLTMENTGPDLVAKLKEGAAAEPVASFLGIRLVELSPGLARVAMTVRPEYLNFNGMIFGGIVMCIADQAFAYGTNSLVSPSIATQFNIHLISGAAPGDELTAECRVIRCGRRIGVSEMTVTNQAGKLIAKATGTTVVTA
jgi:acyl-CoA thioesterase